MIEIKNIYAGWLTFEFHYGEVSQLFTVSYLNDFRDDSLSLNPITESNVS